MYQSKDSEKFRVYTDNSHYEIVNKKQQRKKGYKCLEKKEKEEINNGTCVSGLKVKTVGVVTKEVGFSIFYYLTLDAICSGRE